MSPLRSTRWTATPSVTATRPSISERTQGEPPARRMRARHAPARAARERGEHVRVQREPVERRRAVAHDGIGHPVEPLLQRAARRVRLAVGEPAQAGADDQLDLGAGPAGERRRLQTALAAADHDDPAARVGRRSPGGRSRTRCGRPSPRRRAAARRGRG